jgi:hypothetical protein
VSGEIVTYTGRIFNPLDPSPDDIAIEDIAHALGNICRFTGHVREFYSVAQHSYLASQIVPAEHALTALLHDASEAYLSDVSRPIKTQPEFGNTYKRYEERLERAIADRFGLQWPWPSEVKRADEALLRTEQRDLMPDLLRFEGDYYLFGTISGWTPGRAKAAFLSRYFELDFDRSAENVKAAMRAQS